MKLEIREAKAGDLPQIKHPIDNYISQDFYSDEALERMLQREEDLLFAAVDNDRDGRVAAFFYAFLSPLDEALRMLHVKEKPEVLQKYAGSVRVGVYKTTCTDPAYRKNGIFSAFMADLQPVLRSKGAELLVTTALRPTDRAMATLHILHDTGFVPISELHRPWAETPGYCPYCRQDPCICDAVLYIREFMEKEEDELHG